MSTNPFQRFKQKESGARKKEKIRQEKKKARLETKEYFEQKKKAARHGFISADSRNETNQSRKDPIPPKHSASERKHILHKKTDKAKTNTDRSESSFKGDKKTSQVKITSKPQSQKQDSGSSITSAPVNPSHAAMPLNKFVAHAGICSRRDAADLVKSGTVTVNGKAITEPGYKVANTDEVKVNGKKITSQKNLVYILLNKPKDFITTTEDPQGRKTVMDIVKSATSERVYPIGRLDRNTTGVLLLTNDGELAQKLSHPSYQIKKIYEVKLDRPLHKKDFDTILTGVQLEDGFIAPDVLAYADSKDKSVIGIEIHSGRNRIVRRIFEKLGYDVRNLDRVMYANLTKKNVERGKWRFLQEKEVRLLKYLNASIKKPNNPRRDG
ncbi:MAG TPA: pseudouridine synthase [Flavitalea sp.]|nr:pseudouridine synthase [Flavitalea sp.]